MPFPLLGMCLKELQKEFFLFVACALKKLCSLKILCTTIKFRRMSRFGGKNHELLLLLPFDAKGKMVYKDQDWNSLKAPHI